MVRPSLGAEYWFAMIAEQVASGLGVKQFAASRGISPTALSYWKYQRRRPAPQDTTALAAVRVIDDSPRAQAIELVLDGRRTVRVHPGFDVVTLERLLGVLEPGC